MKKKALSEIKHGIAVCAKVEDSYPVTYDNIQRGLGLDSKTAQKVLADLQKYGYICRTNKGFYVPASR